MNDKRVLLIVGGGIAAYKALELTRLLRKAGAARRTDGVRGGSGVLGGGSGRLTPCLRCGSWANWILLLLFGVGAKMILPPAPFKR